MRAHGVQIVSYGGEATDRAPAFDMDLQVHTHTHPSPPRALVQLDFLALVFGRAVPQISGDTD